MLVTGPTLQEDAGQPKELEGAYGLDARHAGVQDSDALNGYPYEEIRRVDMITTWN